MKVGITCYPTYGGSGVVATELGMELAERGHVVHFISYAPPIRLTTENDRIHFHEVEVVTYPLFEYPPYALSLATKMAEVAENEGLDILHVHYAIPHSISAFLASSMLAPRKLPFVTTLHGTDITLVGLDRSYWPITRFSIQRSDGITAISQYLRNMTLREFELDCPIELIYNFVNCDRYKRDENQEKRSVWAPDGEPIVAHLSNFRPVKRVVDVVEIFDLILKKVPAKLLLIGDGPERATAEWMVRKKCIGRHVHFLGKQPSVHDLLGLIDLFLLPSDLESFGLAALEAMACEVPVIASNVGGVPEVIRHGVDGYLVKPRDVETMAKYAVDLLSNPERRREMGKQAREGAQAQFCASKIIPQYEEYYRRVLARG